MRVGHYGKKRPAVVSNALANRAGELIVRPVASPSFEIRRKVGRDDAPWEIVVRQNLSCTFRARYDGCPRSRPIMRGMAIHAAAQSRSDISPSRQALRRTFKSAACERTRFRPDERTPPDGQSDGNRQNGGERDTPDQQPFPQPPHSCSSVAVAVTSRSTLSNSQFAQIIRDFWASPVHGADKFAADDSVTVDHVGFRPAKCAVEPSRFLRLSPHGDHVDAVVFEELMVRRIVRVNTDGEYYHAFVFETSLHLDQRRGLLDT